MREIFVGDVETETGFEGFRRDFEWISRVRRCGSGFGGQPAGHPRVADGRAALRLWRPAESRISAGRYHRISEESRGIERRLSGGTMVGIGPGTLGLSLFAPSIGWLDPSVERLKPEQVLNRAVRPLLAALREIGVDPVYPGRDLVTLDKRPVAYASFTTFPDGVVIVEMLLSVSDSFRATSDLLAQGDPDGVAVTATERFENAVRLGDFIDVPPDVRFRDAIANGCRQTFDAEVVARAAVPGSSTRADRSSWFAFQAERGPIAAAAASAAGMTQLGVVEIDARIEDRTLRGVNVCGDLIAPFETLDAIAANLEGCAPDRAAIDSAVESALEQPGRFLLGGSELVEIVSRLA